MDPSSSRGYGLIETIITLGAAILLVAGALTVYRALTGSHSAHRTAQHVISLTESINRAWSSSSDYSGISNSRVVLDNLLPDGLEVQGTEPTIRTEFGGRLYVDPAALNSSPDGGVRLTITDVPKRMCQGFVSEAAKYGFRYIAINDRDVLGASGQLQESAVAVECGSRLVSTIAFVADRRTSVSSPSALPGGPPLSSPPAACQLPSPNLQSETRACPPGYLGVVSRTRTASCPPGATLPVWGPWVESGSCDVACTPHPTSPQRRNNTPCPQGQVGAITEERVSTCQGAVGEPVWSAWTVVSNTCAPLCMAPADEVRISPCPAGQDGSVVMRRTASCPSLSGTWSWKAWEVVSNTCH